MPAAKSRADHRPDKQGGGPIFGSAPSGRFVSSKTPGSCAEGRVPSLISQLRAYSAFSTAPWLPEVTIFE
jgi:hypothetical protein